ncbi:DNA/RNA-binding protein Kin17 [Gracilaria domingensis]|nr:DNA/RNA-binding protein Kin17 [Gracilaria domingensis]
MFAENPSDFINRFSETFRKEFLLVLRQRYGTNFVHANTVYQEYIKDRDHVHMNATKWTTLTAFVKELGKEGLCRVEDREDGWWVAYLARENFEKERRAKEMRSHTLESEERAALILRNQVSHARTTGGTRRKPTEDEGLDDGDAKPVSITMSKKAGKRKAIGPPPNAIKSRFFSRIDENESSAKQKRIRSGRWAGFEDAEPTTAAKTGESDTDDENPSPSAGADIPWLHVDTLVKITNTDLADGAFVGKKGRVVKIIDGFGARVQLADSGTVLELDQDDLETVIPKPGGIVYLLRGTYRGKKAVVRSIDIDKFSVRVELLDTNEELSGIEYEAVSRAA